ncbi:hypothetical protein [Tepidimicrobium xylanilyticum]|uniref:hypothetical protein n=1 Tax=Tepidimicrobium xylanilyticum TaxID=1123352 RepID=UPI0013564A9F|nr:hypothetical protein [Tepidimicrobium xylanilyticum]GMG97954.1 hypothetical protein EN5CB1_27800 [Tepidimicrobium xylanilyticum]
MEDYKETILRLFVGLGIGDIGFYRALKSIEKCRKMTIYKNCAIIRINTVFIVQ